MSVVVETTIDHATGHPLDSYTVFCACGEGPDIGINLRRDARISKAYPDSSFVCMDFTIDEAEEMARALTETANLAREWYRQLNEYFDKAGTI